MRIDHLALCFGLPLLFVYTINRYSFNKLKQISLTVSSPIPLQFFVYSRVLYWYVFGVLVTAFLLGMSLFSSGGNLTRSLIAFRTYGTDNVPTFIIEKLSNVLLPLIFVTLFISIISLGFIGRNVLKQIMENGSLDERFTRFRFTFFLMALSLIIPPLAFGSLLLL